MMKRTMMTRTRGNRWAALLMAGCLMMGLTSCLGGGDDNQSAPTREEIQAAYRQMAGRHAGKLLYPQREARSTSDRTDTLDIAWTVTSDSTMVLHNFPVKALAENVTNAELRNLLLTAPSQDLKCNIGIFKVTPKVGIVVQPMPLKYSLKVKGVEKKVEVIFYYNIQGTIAVFDPATRRFDVGLCEAAVLVDGQKMEEFRQGVFMLLTEKGKKQEQ